MNPHQTGGSLNSTVTQFHRRWRDNPEYDPEPKQLFQPQMGLNLKQISLKQSSYLLQPCAATMRDAGDVTASLPFSQKHNS